MRDATLLLERALETLTYAGALASVLFCHVATGQCQYELTIFHGPEDPFWGLLPIDVRGLSEGAEIVGYYWDPLNEVAYKWTQEIGLVPLSFPGEVVASQTTDVNALGQIVGMLDRPDSLGFRAFVWEPDSFIEIPPPAGSWSHAYAINDEGLVVGTTADGTPYHKAFVWANGKMTTLEPTWGPRSAAYDVNGAGEVAGWMGTGIGVDAHPVVWRQGTATDLGLLPGSYSGRGRAMNDQGHVVGSSRFEGKSSWISHATLWSNGAILDLGTLPFTTRCNGLDINAVGQVVGNCNQPGQRAFLWQNGQMHDLNDLGAADAGVFMGLAIAVNDAGQIAGQGGLGGQSVGVLMTPVGRPPGDLDIDCKVGTSDLLMLLTNWGPCPASPESCLGDLDEDDQVGTSDLLLLLSNWGT